MPCAGRSATAITTSLKTFRANLHNAGRANLYRLGQAYIMLDYGHNAAAFHAMASIAENWPAGRVTAVVGLPGNRSDESIGEAARAAAEAFEHVVIREDRDLRGREPGEVALMIEAEVRAAGADTRVCLDTLQAINTAMQGLQPGDLVIVFYEQLDEVVKHLLNSARNRGRIALDCPQCASTAISAGASFMSSIATLIQGGEVYAPEPLGRGSVLILYDRVAHIGASGDVRLPFPIERIDASGCIVTPGLIDPHEHLTGGSGERGFRSQTPEITLSEIVSAGITTVVGCLGSTLRRRRWERCSRKPVD